MLVSGSRKCSRVVRGAKAGIACVLLYLYDMGWSGSSWIAVRRIYYGPSHGYYLNAIVLGRHYSTSKKLSELWVASTLCTTSLEPRK